MNFKVIAFFTIFCVALFAGANGIASGGSEHCSGMENNGFCSKNSECCSKNCSDFKCKAKPNQSDCCDHPH